MSDILQPNWPDVLFRGDEFRPLGITTSAVRELCRSLAREVAEDDLAVVLHKLIVADSAIYGAVIREELGGGTQPTHTDRAQYVGVAKTIPTWSEEGRISNAVIARAGLIAGAFGISEVEPCLPQPLARYVLKHEFGHCIDHVARKRPTLVGLTDAGEFSTRRVATYYGHILMDEFAACVFGGRGLDEATFEWLCQSDAEPLEKELQSVLTERHRYRLGLNDDLRALAFRSSQALWFVLVQYAKLFGHMIATGRASGPVSLPPTIASGPQALQAIEDLARLLAEKQGDYPNWPEDGWPELFDVWNALARSFGFRFEEAGGQSALWLD